MEKRTELKNVLYFMNDKHTNTILTNTIGAAVFTLMISK